MGGTEQIWVDLNQYISATVIFDGFSDVVGALMSPSARKRRTRAGQERRVWPNPRRKTAVSSEIRVNAACRPWLWRRV